MRHRRTETADAQTPGCRSVAGGTSGALGDSGLWRVLSHDERQGQVGDPTNRAPGSPDNLEDRERLPGEGGSGDGETPGAAGHPEPGSQHDDSETTTTAEGPPTKPVDGVPGAFGEPG